MYYIKFQVHICLYRLTSSVQPLYTTFMQLVSLVYTDIYLHSSVSVFFGGLTYLTLGHSSVSDSAREPKSVLVLCLLLNESKSSSSSKSVCAAP